MATAALDAYYLYRKTTDTGRVALSSPTTLFASGVDSSISALTNIGFTFNFNNADYTQFAALQMVISNLVPMTALTLQTI